MNIKHIPTNRRQFLKNAGLAATTLAVSGCNNKALELSTKGP